MQKFLPIVFAFLTLPLLAEDWEKKDPEAKARENHKLAKSLMEEARFMDSAAIKLEDKEAKIVKTYAEATANEAEWLEKSAVAYTKKQVRLAERAQRKAAEYCEKRGKMLGEIEEIRPKLKGNTESKGSKEKLGRLDEINRKQADLEAEKKKLIEQSAN